MKVAAGSVLAELGVFETAKQIDHTETLELCERSIASLEGLGNFGNLKHVWLCRNELSGLDGIEENWRLHSLYASQNHISSLEPVCDLLQLEELVVNDNRIEKLDHQLAFLKRLKRLRRLEMYNNPVAEETQYRYHVIQAVPSLQVLDRVAVTDEERLAAKRLRKATSFQLVVERKREPRHSDEQFVVPEWIRKKIKQKRIRLTFTDKRKTGLVDRDEFGRVLERYGLYDADVVAQFSTKTSPFKVDYAKFLRKALPEESRQQHHEVSACVRMAQARARKIKAAREEAEEKAREEASLVSSTATEDSFTFFDVLKKTADEDDGDGPRPLTSWELLELKKHLATAAKDENDSASVVEAVSDLFGRRCDDVTVDTTRDLLRLASPSENGSPSKLLWTLLPTEEARARADALFEKARNAKDPAEMAKLAVRATKLDKIARIKPPPAKEVPQPPKFQLFDLAPYEGLERRKCLDEYRHVAIGERREETRPTRPTSDILANTGVTLTCSSCLIEKKATVPRDQRMQKPLSLRTEKLKAPTTIVSYI